MYTKFSEVCTEFRSAHDFLLLFFYSYLFGAKLKERRNDDSKRQYRVDFTFSIELLHTAKNKTHEKWLSVEQIYINLQIIHFGQNFPSRLRMNDLFLKLDKIKTLQTIEV